MTIVEVAEYLKANKRTVARWLEQGFFPNAYRMSAQPKSPYLIPVSDVVAFDEARRKLK